MSRAMDEQVTFTFPGMLAGMRRSTPLIVSDFAIGLVFGVLARQAGLSLVQALLMSCLVFGGSVQFVALSLWIMPLPVIAILLTTLVVSARYLLMGAALYPWFSRLPLVKAYTSVFLMVDESWALAMSEFAAGGRDAAFLPGSGLTLFVALLVGMWRGKGQILPWAVAAVVAIAAAHWLPGKWYILLGGLAGSVVGAITNAK